MRKSLLFGAMLLVASCTVQKEEEFENPIQHRYHAVAEEPVDAETRVYADSKLRVRWNEGDHISIFERKTYNQEFEFLGDTGDTAGDFDPVEGNGDHTGGDIEDGHVYSIYPYDNDNKCDYKGKLTVTFPSTQHYKKDSFGVGANIMVAKTNTMDLRFMHVGGYRTFKLFGDGVSVSSVRIESNGPEYLSGRTGVVIGEDGNPAVSFIESSSNSKSVELVCDTPVTLGATVSEAVEFWFVLPPGTLTQGFTVTVTDVNGNEFTKSTSNSIEIKSGVKKSMPAFEVEIESGPVVPVPKAIDLGLSVKWASFNLGATKPEEYADYYAWAETDLYYYYENNSVRFRYADGYDWGTYRWISVGKETFNIKRYCPTVYHTGMNRWTGSESPDDKTEFADYNYVDDAARTVWQGEWRTPTEAEWAELLNNCTWEWVMDYNGTGVRGYLVTGIKPGYTDCSVFLPAAGKYRKTYLDSTNMYGYYWSSSLYLSDPTDAWYLGFSTGGNVYLQRNIRPAGQSVRPVLGIPTLVTSVHLSCYSISLYEGDSFTLSATVSPSDIEDQTVAWSSSDPSVVSVNGGVLEAITEGTAKITVSRDGKEATCNVYVFRNVTTPEAVDLGLNVKWASCNVGAQKTEEYGDYFAWGETEPYYQPGDAQSENPVWKSGKEVGYDWQSYGWCNGSKYTLTRYCTSGQTDYWGGSGSPDGKTRFADYNYVDDAARANWHGEWRTPTSDEWSELKSECEWVLTSLSGTNGYAITSKVNGKRIFLPAAGYRSGKTLYSVGSRFSYWSSEISGDPSSYAYSLGDLDDDGDGRYLGFSVRPVTE